VLLIVSAGTLFDLHTHIECFTVMFFSLSYTLIYTHTGTYTFLQFRTLFSFYYLLSHTHINTHTPYHVYTPVFGNVFGHDTLDNAMLLDMYHNNLFEVP